jgi:uncharacterized membrane protein YcaP (DUF421 family)
MFLKIITKTIFLYFFIIASYRVMGKKEIGKLSIIDLIVSMLIAELAALSIETADRKLITSVLPISILVILQIILSYVSLKNAKFRIAMEGHPKVIIQNGKIKFKEMTKLRYSLDDLVTQLREQSIKSIEEVSYAVLENNGKLSIFQNISDYPLPLILDGLINEQVLKDIHKSKDWVMDILKQKNLTLDNVFYAFYTKEKTFIIKKSDLLA